MENLISSDAVLAMLAGNSSVLYLLDFLLKSSFIVGATFLIARVFRQQISNNGSHLLWLSCMLCIAFLPLGMAVLSSFSAIFLDSGPVTVIHVSSAATGSPAQPGLGSQFFLGFCYLAIAALLLSRLLVSALALKRINHEATYCADSSILKSMKHISASLAISRTVIVKLSNEIASPMSFGLFKPVVVLPVKVTEWSESTVEDVLVHELSHIKRLDWATMLFCHVAASVLWINPLVWFAKNRVNEAAEQACDAAVLRYGKDGVGYAEDLLRLARESFAIKQAPILAQLMFDEGSLTMRIRNILDGKLIGRVSKLFVAGLTLSVLLIVSACSGINLFGSSLQELDFLPTNTAIPQYPSKAAQEGIEGWALVSFTVKSDGLVEENSVQVLDAEPAEIFDRTSINAAKKFEFQPRVRNGRAVDVPGVQYVFRYLLEPGGSQPEGQRPPPPARS
ncbi:MAG: M56 family metallopeptidase [Pseudohongiellaceae bacterium]